MILRLFRVAFVGHVSCQHDRKAIFGTALIVELWQEKYYFEHMHVAAFIFGLRNVSDVIPHTDIVTTVSILLLD